MHRSRFFHKKSSCPPQKTASDVVEGDAQKKQCADDESLDASTRCDSPSTGHSTLSCTPPLTSSSAIDDASTSPHQDSFYTTVSSIFLKCSNKVFSRGYSLPSLVSRHSEQHKVLSLVHQIVICDAEPSPPLIYVYGAPGTGKTTTIMYAMSLLDTSLEMKEYLCSKWNASSIYINGALLSTLEEFLSTFARLVSPTLPTNTLNQMIRDAADTGLRQTLLSIILFTPYRQTRSSSRVLPKKTVIVLDEVDHLNALRKAKPDDKGRKNPKHPPSSVFEDLCHVLLLPEVNGRIVLIGISNSFSHTTCGTLSGTTTAPSTKFHTIIFETYTPKDLCDIVNHRLTIARSKALSELQQRFPDVPVPVVVKHLESLNPFPKPHLHLLAQKLAAQNGDCRQLVDICRATLSKQLSQLEWDRPPRCEHSACDTTSDTSADSVNSPSLEVAVQSPEKRSRTHSVSHPSTKERHASCSLGRDINNLSEQMRRFSFHDTLLNDFERRHNACKSIISTLPLQQQVLVCAVCCVIKNDYQHLPSDNTTVDVTAKSIHAMYSSLCETHGLSKTFQDIQQLYVDGLTSLYHQGVLRFSRQPVDFKKAYVKSGGSHRIQSRLRRPCFSADEIASATIRLCFPLTAVTASLTQQKQLFHTLLQVPVAA